LEDAMPDPLKLAFENFLDEALKQTKSHFGLIVDGIEGRKACARKNAR
jgi:hypothetical protein